MQVQLVQHTLYYTPKKMICQEKFSKNGFFINIWLFWLYDVISVSYDWIFYQRKDVKILSFCALKWYTIYGINDIIGLKKFLREVT